MALSNKSAFATTCCVSTVSAVAIGCEKWHLFDNAIPKLQFAMDRRFRLQIAR
jgi:hypothetical protein